MGVTAELVKSVFSRTKSAAATQESSGRSNAVNKRRWSSVRSYLCGDEFNSVLAEEDSASVKSSEATVTQPMQEELTEKGDFQSKETKENIPDAKKKNSISKLFHEEDAAIVIQSAFRNFLARRQNKEMKSKDDKQEGLLAGTESPSRNSVGTSIEVQTGNSVEVLSVPEESIVAHNRVPQKARTQVFRIKEDWDDSTVSSNISKMRMQNRLEATTRRERALAYAFSQQLRICSKKKQKSDGTEPNMGWSWLERWMATRLPESLPVESSENKQHEKTNSTQKFVVRKRFFDIAGEEKESCGSNEVSVHLDVLSAASTEERDVYQPAKNTIKASRNVSRRKTVPTHQCPKENIKVGKKECSKESEQDSKRQKPKQTGNKKEIKCKNASSQPDRSHEQ